jgi:hypothetical protein
MRLAPDASRSIVGGLTMTIQREQPRLGAIAVLVSVLLLAIAGVAGVYRLSASSSRSKATAPSAPLAEPVYASSMPPRVVETGEPMTARVAAPGVSGPAASPTEPKTENAGMSQPFIEARQERRDSVWALQMESSVRDALVALRDKKVTLASVQCASIRCTLEGAVGRGGSLQDIVTAVSKVGLTQGRFKQNRDGDGTTTFSAVIARKGYKLDGSPKEAAAKAL